MLIFSDFKDNAISRSDKVRDRLFLIKSCLAAPTETAKASRICDKMEIYYSVTFYPVSRHDEWSSADMGS